MATHLITGANGYVGFHVLLDALRAGHRVRATVRNNNRVQEILGNDLVKEQLSSRGGDVLEVLEVPDILDATAYDTALSGGSVTHIIHVATPLPFPTANPRRDIIDPSVLGTQNLLHAASRVRSVRRIVLTSSLVANLAWPPDVTVRTTPSTRIANPSEEEMNRPDMDFMTAYRYSKITALNAADAFIKEHGHVSFDIVNVFPGFVHGPNLLATTSEKLSKGSNRLMLGVVTGQTLPGPRLAGAVHIADIAKVHLAALDEKIVSHRSGRDLAATQPIKYDDAWEIAQRRFPEAAADGTLKQGRQASLEANWDASETEKLCGIKFQPFENMIVDLTEQHLRLAGRGPQHVA